MSDALIIIISGNMVRKHYAVSGKAGKMFGETGVHGSNLTVNLNEVDFVIWIQIESDCNITKLHFATGW